MPGVARWMLAVLLCLGPVFSHGAAEGRVTSKFTRTAPRVVTSGTQEDGDDPSSFSRRSRGLGGYDLEHVGGDERTWLNVRFAGRPVDLHSATMEIGGGAGYFPHKANDVVEWRGLEKNGRFKPFALIYRIRGLDENGRWNRTRLMVIKLDREQTRVVGYADEPGADAKAKAIADRAQPRR